MKRIIAILLALFFLLPEGSSQQAKKREVLLGFQGGVGYGLYRDLGASPLTYRGPELLPGVKVAVQGPLWRYETRLALSAGGYGPQAGIAHLQALGGQAAVGFEAMRIVLERGRWQLWAGASLDDRADLRYNSALENSSVGASNFVNLNLIGQAEMRLGRWLLHGRLALSPMSVLLRPGYAYMDNYDHEISSPLADFMGQYQWYPAGMTFVSTALGATLLLHNGNRVGLAYQWHYMTSRTTSDQVTAPYLFEQAGHALLLALDFQL